MEDTNMTLNMNGGQFNYAKDTATINATQNNGVNGKELDDIIDSDLINMSTPIFICERIKDKIHIVDSSENVFTIELDDFLYADINHMGKDTEFGFLIEPHRAVAVHLKNDRYIILYYQLIGESVLL